jgi:ATP-dependent DNA ligase
MRGPLILPKIAATIVSRSADKSNRRIKDVLHLKGRDLLDKRIEERKEYLAEIAQDFIRPIQPIFEFGPGVDLDTAITVVSQMKIEGFGCDKKAPLLKQGLAGPL